MDVPGHLLVALAVLLALCQILRAVAIRIGQPPVMGQLLAGIALGPSVLGAVSGSWQHALFPAQVLPIISALASLGVTLFMLDVGLGFELPHLRGWRVPFLGAWNVAVPFAAGCGLATALWAFRGGHASRPAFVLFMGVAMSITAFPVLARILDETGLARTPLANRALAVAAIGDVAAWTLLAAATAVAAHHSAWGSVRILAELGAVTVGWLLVGRRLLSLVGANPATVVVAALALGALTDWIGVHPIFGGFLAGVVVRPAEAHAISVKLSGTIRTLLLPVFFVATGLATSIGTLGLRDIWVIAACLAVAAGGKLGAGTLGARIAGSDWREAAATGALLNTRGLTELVVLSVGLQSGVLSGQLFSALVVVALVTTAMTRPLLARLGLVAASSEADDVRPAQRLRIPRHRPPSVAVPDRAVSADR